MKWTENNARKELAKYNMVIRKDASKEFRVNFRGGKEATAYYTADLQDAVETGKKMSGTQQATPMKLSDAKQNILRALLEGSFILVDNSDQSQQVVTMESHDGSERINVNTFLSLIKRHLIFRSDIKKQGNLLMTETYRITTTGRLAMEQFRKIVTVADLMRSLSAMNPSATVNILMSDDAYGISAVKPFEGKVVICSDEEI